MKRWVITISIVSTCVVGGVLWLYRVNLARGVGDSRLPQESAVFTPKKGWSTPDSGAAMEDVDEMSDRDDPAKVRRVIESGNVPIKFWGRVVDQDGVPLSGVRIAYMYSIHHGNDQGVAWIEHEMRKGETRSDSDGSFSITDLTGHDLTIESVTKTDYVYRKRSSLTYKYGGNMPESRFAPQRDNPVCIVMIHKDALESLIHMRGSLDVLGDGAAERWNLWSGEADASGELAITFKADPGVSASPAQLVSWSADLSVVGGGITEAPWGEGAYRAPESGYSATVAYPRRDQKQGVPRRGFYLQTADGKYGRLEVELSPSHDGRTARCFITSDMNPRPGSRNLESTEDE